MIEETRRPHTLRRIRGGVGYSIGDDNDTHVVPDQVEPKAHVEVPNQDGIGDNHDGLANEGFHGGPSDLTLLTWHVNHDAFRLWQTEVYIF